MVSKMFWGGYTNIEASEKYSDCEAIKTCFAMFPYLVLALKQCESWMKFTHFCSLMLRI